MLLYLLFFKGRKKGSKMFSSVFLDSFWNWVIFCKFTERTYPPWMFSFFQRKWIQLFSAGIFFNNVFFIIIRVTYWRKSLLNLCSSLVLEKLHALVFRKWHYNKITSSLLLLLNPWNNSCPSITCGTAANFTFTSGCSLAISFQTLFPKAKRLLWARAIKEQPEVLLS